MVHVCRTLADQPAAWTLGPGGLEERHANNSPVRQISLPLGSISHSMPTYVLIQDSHRCSRGIHKRLYGLSKKATMAVLSLKTYIDSGTILHGKVIRRSKGAS